MARPDVKMNLQFHPTQQNAGISVHAKLIALKCRLHDSSGPGVGNPDYAEVGDASSGLLTISNGTVHVSGLSQQGPYATTTIVEQFPQVHALILCQNASSSIPLTRVFFQFLVRKRIILISALFGVVVTCSHSLFGALALGSNGNISLVPAGPTS